MRENLDVPAKNDAFDPPFSSMAWATKCRLLRAVTKNKALALYGTSGAGKTRSGLDFLTHTLLRCLEHCLASDFEWVREEMEQRPA